MDYLVGDYSFTSATRPLLNSPIFSFSSDPSPPSRSYTFLFHLLPFFPFPCLFKGGPGYTCQKKKEF